MRAGIALIIIAVAILFAPEIFGLIGGLLAVVFGLVAAILGGIFGLLGGLLGIIFGLGSVLLLIALPLLLIGALVPACVS